MGNRVVYGNTHSSNGWPMVDQGSCTWVDIPGTSPTVRIQIQNGQPLAILRAFVADINAYVEHVTDNDTACWTATNSVSTSNHLSGSAVDISWDRHPFRIADAGWNRDQINTIREILDFYEGTVFWGNDWTDPKDAMHFQLASLANGGDINTYNNPHTQDFINRKIRADGYSTFRRGGSTNPPPPPALNAADVLARATGISAAKAQEILPTVIDGLRLSQCDNVNRIAMWLAQVGHESASFVYTEEIAKNGRYAPYIGRTWIQITWESNYRDFGEWCFEHGLIDDAAYFVNNPSSLADLRWAGIGPAWYWTVQRPQINELCDQRNLTAVTQAINGGQNGAADRKQRYDRALGLGDELLALTTEATTEDDMAQVPQEQWDRVYQELTKKFPSRSPLRHLGEGLVDTMAGFLLNVDSSQHVEIVRLLAGYGHPPTLALLREVAGADPNKYPDRQDDAKLAQAILAEVTAPKDVATPVPTLVETRPQIEYLPAAAPAPTSSTGQIIGQAYDALEALLASGALTGSEQAPLTALIGVLQSKAKGAAK